MIRQLDWNPMTDHFIPQAVLGKAPDYFEQRGMNFTQSCDGLDYFKGAYFLMDEATPFVLKQYRGHNRDHTTIYLNPEIHDLDEITTLVAAVVSDLQLAPSDILWQRKDNPLA
jgi:hypothetical protein